MSQAPSVAFAANSEDTLAGASANVSLRGTTRGLEIMISGTPSTAALGARLTELFAEAPSFFAGSSARVAIDGALPSGALGCLEEVAERFEVQIVEIGPVVAQRRRLDVPAVLRPEDVPQVHLAEGTGPIPDEAVEVPVEVPNDAMPIEAAPSDGAPTEMALANTAPINAASVDAAPSDVAPGTDAPSSVASIDMAPVVAAPNAVPADAAPTAAQADALASVAAAIATGTCEAGQDEPNDSEAHVAAAPPGPRLVTGPVRSGVIVDHAGHVIVIGDVNPGAEVRAEGSIIVLGRLRGVAHAAIGREVGCIIALSLQPQQLRIGRMVARAADADHPGDGAEIAYATGETIVVERFWGRLPSGLAASM
jgi:septum formation inhibitor MinC